MKRLTKKELDTLANETILQDAGKMTQYNKDEIVKSLINFLAASETAHTAETPEKKEEFEKIAEYYFGSAIGSCMVAVGKEYKARHK